MRDSRVFDADALQLYDTTLRDGSPGEGMAFSIVDKLTIAGPSTARTIPES